VTTPTTVELRYQRGDASADEITAAVADILAELDDPDGELAREASAAGLDVGALAGATIEVRERAQGLEPVLTSIIVGITVRTTSSMAEALWTRVIWPRLRRRLGVRAILGRQDPSGEQPGP
jgi:hypothetical protein